MCYIRVDLVLNLRNGVKKEKKNLGSESVPHFLTLRTQSSLSRSLSRESRLSHSTIVKNNNKKNKKE